MGMGEEIASFLDGEPPAQEEVVKSDEENKETSQGEQTSVEGGQQESDSVDKTEEKSKETPAEGATSKVEEKKVEGKQKDEKTVWAEERAALMTEIARISALSTSPAEVKQEEKPELDKDGKPVEKQAQAVSFVKTKEEMAEIFDSPESFNKFLTTFQAQTHENALRGMPQLIGNIVRHNIVVEATVRDFYQRNPEFANIKPFVALTINEVETKNPGKPIAETIAAAEVLIRERLRLVKQEKKNEEKKETPAFVKGGGGGGGRRGAPAPSGNSVSEQIGELIDR